MNPETSSSISSFSSASRISSVISTFSVCRQINFFLSGREVKPISCSRALNLDEASKTFSAGPVKITSSAMAMGTTPRRSLAASRTVGVNPTQKRVRARGCHYYGPSPAWDPQWTLLDGPRPWPLLPDNTFWMRCSRGGLCPRLALPPPPIGDILTCARQCRLWSASTGQMTRQYRR